MEVGERGGSKLIWYNKKELQMDDSIDTNLNKNPESASPNSLMTLGQAA